MMISTAEFVTHTLKRSRVWISISLGQISPSSFSPCHCRCQETRSCSVMALTMTTKRTGLIFLAFLYFFNVVSTMKHSDFKTCNQVPQPFYQSFLTGSRVSVVAIVTWQHQSRQIHTTFLRTHSQMTYLSKAVYSRPQS